MNIHHPKNEQYPQSEVIPQLLEIHPSISAKAAELLMKTSKRLMQQPEAYNQSWPIHDSCGTPCCILGHCASFIGRTAVGPCDATLVGLTDSQFYSLFWRSRWPDQFSFPLNPYGVNAETAVARIEYFLRTGK